MSNAVSALTGDFSGVYYNPAALAGTDHSQVVFGIDWVHPTLDFDFEETSRWHRHTCCQALTWGFIGALFFPSALADTG